MNVAALPFEFGMIDGFMAGNRREFVAGGSVGHQATILVDIAANDAHGAAVI